MHSCGIYVVKSVPSAGGLCFRLTLTALNAGRPLTTVMRANGR
jgi:hypothetical protein